MSSQVAVFIYNLCQLYPNKTRKYIYIYYYIMKSVYDIGIKNVSIVDLKKTETLKF